MNPREREELLRLVTTGELQPKSERVMADAMDITRILRDVSCGESSAAERLFPVVYDELKRIAAAANSGDSRTPNTGYRTPAATGTPAVLYANAKNRF